MRMLQVLLPLMVAVTLVGSAEAMAPARGECAGAGGDQPSRCLYRSLLPSAGLVADCKTDADCRVGYYYGRVEEATWLPPPPGLTRLPKPAVFWRTATLAEARFDCGAPCTVSYFFDARRKRLSVPRAQVLDVDTHRSLVIAAEARALVVRHLFSGREITRIERSWAEGRWLGEVVTSVRFDPDGRLSFTWLRGPDRTPVTERVSVPTVPPRP